MKNQEIYIVMFTKPNHYHFRLTTINTVEQLKAFIIATKPDIKRLVAVDNCTGEWKDVILADILK